MSKLLLSLVLSITILAIYGFPCTVDIWSVKTKTLSGIVVTEDNKPIPNALVQIYKNLDEGIQVLSEAQTNKDGRFSIQDIGSGKFMLRANLTNIFTFSYASVKYSRSDLKNSKEIKITLVPYSECSGKIEMIKVSK